MAKHDGSQSDGYRVGTKGRRTTPEGSSVRDKAGKAHPPIGRPTDDGKHSDTNRKR